MTYGLIAARLFATAALLVNLRCELLILDIRSKPLFLFCTALGFVTSELGRITGTPGIIALFVINPLITVAAPIALSRGPLRVRVARVLVVDLTSLLSEVVCTLCYLWLEGEPVYTSVTASNFAHIIATYMAGTLVHVLVTEFVIARLRDTDPSWEVQLELPILAFVLGSYLFLSLGIYRFSESGSENPVIPLLILVVAALSIALSFALHRIVQIETMRTREAAYRAASLRQARHVRHQIERSAARVLDMRRLRHDLSNQIGVVVELARAGHIEEADHYLTELLELSQDILGDAHE